MKIAVVTGASSGMGRDFVYAVDREFELDEIWVVARRKERLEELAGSGKCRAKIRPVTLDLSKEESYREYKALLEAEKPEVDVLVNAAGYGLFGTFTEMDVEDQLGIVDVNARALFAHLCRLFPDVPCYASEYAKTTGESWGFTPVRLRDFLVDFQ